MSKYRYGVRHRFIPSSGDPLREPLTEEEVQRNLRLFVEDLPAYFGEIPITVAITSDHGLEYPLVVEVNTDTSHDEANDAVAACMIGLQLIGARL